MHMKHLFIFIIVIFVSGIIFFSFVSDLRNNDLVRKRDSLEALLLISKQMEKMWLEGDSHDDWKEGRKKCTGHEKHFKGVYDAYLKCNPHFFACRLKDIYQNDYHFKVRYKNKDLLIKVLDQNKKEKKLFKTVKAPYYGSLFTLVEKNEDIGINLVLRDSCRSSKLPKRVYAYGPAKSGNYQNDIKWDNFNKTIFVDKYMVTVRDVVEWFEFSRQKSSFLLRSKYLNKNLWAYPATFLNRREMEKYCHFRGKKVLSASVYDAMTFYPYNLTKMRPKLIYRGPYPWSKKKNDTFLYQALMYSDFQIKSEHCLKVYTKECKEINSLFKYFSESVSWVGMFQILGGYLEYVENKIDSEKNLKASSFYFKSHSSWHALGERAYWDGEGFLHINFNWFNKPPEKDEMSYEVGFRCMRTIVDEK
jgi:hypothetical protein